MRTVKAGVLLAVIVAVAAPLRAQAGKVCGLASGASLRTYQDSTENSGASALVAAGMNQVLTFPDVKALLAAFPGKVCVNAVPLSKNIYQYYRLLVVLTFGEDGKDAVAPMIFQAASVQAYENVGQKPWLGFGRDRFNRSMNELLAEASFQDGAWTFSSPVELLPVMFPGSEDKLDPSSRSYLLIPDADPEWTTYLVSQLRFYNTGNPFTSQYVQDAGIVQVKEREGRMRWAAVGGFFNRASAFEDAQWEEKPAGSSRADRAAKLVQLSLGAARRASFVRPSLEADRADDVWK